LEESLKESKDELRKRVDGINEEMRPQIRPNPVVEKEEALDLVVAKKAKIGHELMPATVVVNMTNEDLVIDCLLNPDR